MQKSVQKTVQKSVQRKRGRRVLKGTLWGLAIVLVLGVGGIVAWSQIGVMGAEPEPLADVRANSAVTVEDAEQGIVLSPAEGRPTAASYSSPGRRSTPGPTPPSCRASPRTASRS